MTRSEILQVAKPILFKTEMVRAILDGRKMETRRVIKPQPWCDYPRDCGCPGWDYGKVDGLCPSHCVSTPEPPYKLDDYLYIRESWLVSHVKGKNGVYSWTCQYKSDLAEQEIQTSDFEKYSAFGRKYFDKPGWIPSIHMPKEAARIFLRVTDVRVERLKDMTADSAMSEGFTDWNDVARVWDSTITPKDRDKYGWAANPWVWVIEFERVEVTE